MAEQEFMFGFAHERQQFEERNKEFLFEVKSLTPVIQTVFDRVLYGCLADLLVFTLGRQALEDFGAIELLAANGYGLEAQKLLRGMYERTVAMAYLSKFRDEAQNFVEYSKIERYQLATRSREAGLLFSDAGKEELLRDIESEYPAAREQFAGTPCRSCGQRQMPAWTRLTVKAMAKKAGHNLETAYVSCCLFPTKKMHVTPIGVARSLYHHKSGAVSLREPDSRDADYAVTHAHWLLITVLQVQDEHFGLGLRDALAGHDARMSSVWKSQNAREI